MLQVGAQLTVDPGRWAAAPPPRLHFAWRRDAETIEGASGVRYVLTEADVGKMISARVTAENAAGSATATTAPIGPVTASATSYRRR
jgi:hypothetical protein